MPRNGSGVYAKPAGTTAVPNTTIASANYNATVDDLVLDANAARPIVAGGTGATTAAGILAATGVTASVAEVNILDGVTASAAELNILDGVTATAAELNILDGAALTVTELNYVDGVTSAIQTQLNAKAPIIADPNADRIRFWDDSAGAEDWLTPGTGLSITGTTLNAAASGYTLVSSSSTWTSGRQTVTGLGGYSTILIVGDRTTMDVTGNRLLRVGDAGGILTTSIYCRVQGALTTSLRVADSSTSERSFTIVIERFNTAEAAKPITLTSETGTNADGAIAVISTAVLTQIQILQSANNINGGTLYVWGKP